MFHILEHSVLCGSKRFPVKEPFVDLLKSSMQTFLNAMTFSDKTLYPVASTNEQDLRNLMDVYLDAVFHPQIYSKETIFQQEGWHYELQDDALVYNGVVFNEMKGALSDASSVLYQHLQSSLFPATCYAFESGGTPEAIPTLTYDAFLDDHRRHYRTDNSYIILYGNLDIESTLGFLDERYLTPVAAEQARADKEREAAGRPLLRPRSIEHQAPLNSAYAAFQMDTSPENACAGFSTVIGDFSDHKRVVAAEVLMDALLGSNEAPLKRALLDAGIAQDILVSSGDPSLQPFVTVELRMPAPGAAQNLPTMLATESRKLLDAGLDGNLIEAALSHLEFVMREHEFGIADGVVYAMQCLSGWLYDDECATEYLRFESLFAELREDAEAGYFEQLLEDLFCNPAHTACVEIVPAAQSEPNAQALKLAKLYQSLSAEDRQRIIDDMAALRKAQEAPDSPEALATLPRLSIVDIDEPPTEPAYELTGDAPLPCLRHDVATHGIAYAYRYYPLDAIAFDDLPYVSVLAMVLGKLSTTEHDAAELDTLVQRYLGNLSFYTDIFEDKTSTRNVAPRLVVSSSALAENVKWLASLPLEVMLRTRFDDKAKVLDILRQRKIAIEQAFINAGHSCACARVRSYCTTAGVMGEKMTGVDFYQWLCDLLEHFDERCDLLMEKLARVCETVFCDNGSLVSFAGNDECYDAYWDMRPLCGRAGSSTQALQVPDPAKKTEAFIVPSDVTYSALGWDRRLLDELYDGMWLVAARALSYGYLWNEVRVKGGAYGVGFQAVRKGNLCFYSYRDPHIDETLQRFCEASSWLGDLKITQEELEGFVVAVVASLDAPIKPRALVKRQDSDFFSKFSPVERLAVRKEAIQTTTEGLHGFAATVREVTSEDARCVFGNAQIIESSKLHWDATTLIG